MKSSKSRSKGLNGVSDIDMGKRAWVGSQRFAGQGSRAGIGASRERKLGYGSQKSEVGSRSEVCGVWR